MNFAKVHRRGGDQLGGGVNMDKYGKTLFFSVYKMQIKNWSIFETCYQKNLNPVFFYVSELKRI